MKLFGKKKPTANESIEKMRESLDLLEKRERVVTLKRDEEVKKAKECMKKKNKNGALICMKRKKAYDDQLAKIGTQKLNIDAMIMKLEAAATDMDMFHAQTAGAEALRNIYGKNTTEKIDRKMDEVRDTIDSANEISDAIAQPLGLLSEMDDDELLQELADLENEDLQNMLDMDTKVPPTSLRQPASASAIEEEDDFAALESDMAI